MRVAKRRISIASIIVFTLGVIVLAGTHSSAGESDKKANTYQIAIQDFSFHPATLTVPMGTRVTWTNKDEEPHTVFSSDSVFKSKALDTDDNFSFTFSKPGTYEYFCSVHPKMVAKIIVEASSHKKSPMKSMKMGPVN
ncbi:MAG TPA: cupredoxin family copper-binding protein [Candidatus Acidoferrales bacterium]|nr:cupredoxin family copper-binding protein [Candidatus Acidoferrales bacterium]